MCWFLLGLLITLEKPPKRVLGRLTIRRTIPLQKASPADLAFPLIISAMDFGVVRRKLLQIFPSVFGKKRERYYTGNSEMGKRFGVVNYYMSKYST